MFTLYLAYYSSFQVIPFDRHHSLFYSITDADLGIGKLRSLHTKGAIIMARRKPSRARKQTRKPKKMQISNKAMDRMSMWLLRAIVVGLAAYGTWLYFGAAIVASGLIPIVCLAIICPVSTWLAIVALRPFAPSMRQTFNLMSQWVALSMTTHDVPKIGKGAIRK